MKPIAFILAGVVALASLSPASAQTDDLVSISVRDALLTDVIGLIARQGRLNVIPDGSIPPTRVGAMTLTGVSAHDALKAVEKAYGLREVLDGTFIRLVALKAPGSGLETGDTVAIAVPGGNASQIVSSLAAAVPGVVLVASPNGKMIVASGLPDMIVQIRKIVAAVTNIPDGTALGDAVSIGVSNGTASDLLSRLSAAGFADPPSIVVADDARSRLLVRATDSDLQKIKSAVSLMDQSIQKVTFDCQILDLSPSSNSNVGVQWGGVGSSGTVTVGSTFTNFLNKVVPINATLNAMISNGTATVLARPSISVRNGMTGKVLVGEQYPVVITNGTLVGGSNVQFVQIGVQLSIQPTIGVDGTISVDLTTTYSELDGTVSGYPIVGQRTVQTNLSVRDGEPIVIAGLFQDITSDTVSKVPLLGNIPILGEVFKNRTKSSQRDEIVFALYPHLGVPSAKPESNVVAN
jgi:type II secretory pathway component GspD/PulD (secretin)